VCLCVVDVMNLVEVFGIMRLVDVVRWGGCSVDWVVDIVDQLEWRGEERRVEMRWEVGFECGRSRGLVVAAASHVCGSVVSVWWEGRLLTGGVGCFVLDGFGEED
jgi:hypothetical protein